MQKTYLELRVEMWRRCVEIAATLDNPFSREPGSPLNADLG